MWSQIRVKPLSIAHHFMDKNKMQSKMNFTSINIFGLIAHDLSACVVVSPSVFRRNLQPNVCDLFNHLSLSSAHVRPLFLLILLVLLRREHVESSSRASSRRSEDVIGCHARVCRTTPVTKDSRALRSRRTWLTAHQIREMLLCYFAPRRLTANRCGDAALLQEYVPFHLFAVL